jgi:replicative DNA helicase
VCRAIFALAERDVAVDTVTLGDELRRRKDLEKVGGEVWLAELLDSAVTAANAEYHVRIVQEKAQLRRLILIGKAIERGVADGASVSELMAKTEKAVFDVGNDYESTRYRTLLDSMPEVMNALEARVDDSRNVTGIPTGFPEFDTKTLGIQKREFSVVAARPSVGKTAFGLSIAMNAAKNGSRVLVASLEMSEQSLVDRMISMEARIDGMRIRGGYLNSADLGRVVDASGRLSDLPIAIDDGSGQTVFEIRAKARRQMVETPFDMLIVDYVQLIESSRQADTRAQEIGLICRALKGMAKDLNVAVVALAQLKRPGQGQERKRPLLSDLKESGSIEESADLVAFIHRPELHDNDPKFVGLAEIIIAKQRNGPIGWVNLRFVKEEMRFENLGGHDAPPDY